jgi:hypothetical protein
MRFCRFERGGDQSKPGRRHIDSAVVLITAAEGGYGPVARLDSLELAMTKMNNTIIGSGVLQERLIKPIKLLGEKIEELEQSI